MPFGRIETVARATPILLLFEVRGGMEAGAGHAGRGDKRADRPPTFTPRSSRRAFLAPAEPGLQAVAVVIEARVVPPEVGVRVVGNFR